MNSKFVHVDEAIATAETFLPDGMVLNRTFARQWAYLGLRDIGPGDHWFSECVLHPNDNGSMVKPTDMYKPIDIALYGRGANNALCELRFSYKGLGHRIHQSSNPLESNAIYAPQLGAPISLSEDSYCFHLGSNGIGIVEVAHLKYWKLPIGADGLPLIPEHQALAIAFFIVWMWNKKQNDKSGMQLAKMDYMQLRGEARSKNNIPNGIAFEQIAKDWTSLLNAPQFKQF